MSSQSQDAENRWFKQLQVCSYQAFDRYFQFATPEGDVSQADIDDLIGSMGTIANLDRIFEQLTRRDLLDVMLTRLASLRETLPLEHAATFLASLYQMKVAKRQYSLFEPSPKDRVQNITYWYLQRLPEAKRLQVMQEALQLTRGLSFAIGTVAYLTHEPNSTSINIPFFGDQANRECLKQAGLRAIVRAISPDSQITPEEMLSTVNFWAHLDNAAAKNWLANCLRSRSAIVSYLGLIVSTSEGTGGTRRSISALSFKDLISIEDLEEQVDQHLKQELTADEAELLGLFRKAVKNSREGKEQAFNVWDVEDVST